MAMAARQHIYLATYLAVIATSVLAYTFNTPGGAFCGTSGSYMANSTYLANIQRLASTLPGNASSSPTLFATSQTGAVPNVVYALALCRGDVDADTCGECVVIAFQDAQQRCAYSKDATIFYELCLLRYSNQDFLSVFSTTTTTSSSDHEDDSHRNILVYANTQNVTAPSFGAFDAAVGALLNATADYSAANSSKRFGTAVEPFRAFDDSRNPWLLYALVQCTPDMAPAECRSCLAGILRSRLQHFSGEKGDRILGLRCNYMYEQYAFFFGSPLLRLPEPHTGAPLPAPDPVANLTRPAAGGERRE